MAIIDNDKCMICKGKNVKRYPAKFADFISARVFGGQNKDLSFVHCQDCGFAFYNYRYEEDEVKKLYSDYRDEEYQKQRQVFESWYTPEINKYIGNNEKEINSRNSHLTDIIKEFILSQKESAEDFDVLDFGGDRGQFIPALLNKAKKFVYDISDKPVLEGIEKLSSAEELEGKKFDFIICCHVLEHVSNPYEILKTIKSLLNPNGFVYIEVPFDSPFYQQRFSKIGNLFNNFFAIKDIIKSKIRHGLKAEYYQHEHINFYTVQALKFLLEDNHYEVLNSDIFNVKTEFGNSKCISILARI